MAVAIVVSLVHHRVGTVLVSEAPSSAKAGIVVSTLHHVVGIGSHRSIGIEAVLSG